MALVKTYRWSTCAEIIGWFAGGNSLELRLSANDLLYGEEAHGWNQVLTIGQSIADGSWHSVAVVRNATGEVRMFVDSHRVDAVGHVPPTAPSIPAPTVPRSTRMSDCAFNGEVM